MPAFQYKAIDKLGRPARGKLDAANDVDLELRLKRMGLDLITFRAIRSGHTTLAKGSVTRRDLIAFCFDLEQISRSGIPVVEGLRDLRDGTENPRFREMLSSVLEDIEGGKMLSQGLAAFPNVFGSVFVSLVRAGEQSGRVTEVFESLGAALKWQDELVSQTRKLLIYPAMVFIVVTGVTMFLLLYLVPQVVTLLKSMGMPLPLQTRILIGISNFTVNYWYIVLITPMIAVARDRLFHQDRPQGSVLLRLHQVASTDHGSDPAEDHPGALRQLLRVSCTSPASRSWTPSRPARRSWEPGHRRRAATRWPADQRWREHERGLRQPGACSRRSSSA